MDRKHGILEVYFILTICWFITAWIMFFVYIIFGVDLGIIKALEGIDNNILLLIVLWLIMDIPAAFLMESIDWALGMPLGLYKERRQTED